MNYPYQVFYWENGKLGRAYIKDGELCYEPFMYVHIKKRKFKDISFDMDKAEAFYITSDEFICRDINEKISKETIKKYNPYYGAVYEWLEYDYLSRIRAKRVLKKG